MVATVSAFGGVEDFGDEAEGGVRFRGGWRAVFEIVLEVEVHLWSVVREGEEIFRPRGYES